MSSTIQIKFLTLEEMARASELDPRYEFVGVDNLGFADKEKNKVFVRADVEPQLTRYLIDHELEHLFEMEGTDEDENGIRHKKKGGFMRIFVPIVGAILGSLVGGPVGGSLLGGLLGGTAGTAVGTGTGAMLGGVAGSSATGKPNWLGNTIGGATAGVGSGLGSALSGLGSGTASSTLSNAKWVGSGLEGGGAFLPIASGAEAAALGGVGSAAGGSSVGQSIGSLIGGTAGNYFAGALGQGQKAQGGFSPTSSSSSFRMPDLSQQANANPMFSGWSQDVAMPTDPYALGASGASGITGTGERTGSGQMPLNPGLNQPGLSNFGRDVSTPFGQQNQNGINSMFNLSNPWGGF